MVWLCGRAGRRCNRWAFTYRVDWPKRRVGFVWPKRRLGSFGQNAGWVRLAKTAGWVRLAKKLAGRRQYLDTDRLSAGSDSDRDNDSMATAQVVAGSLNERVIIPAQGTGRS